ncbi:MAG: TspO/MBR family protein [Candidatus Micrarchaeota archaeon]
MELDFKKLGICLALCFVAAAIGSVFTFESIPTWYAGLEKPFFNPPNWVFSPVWTLLYFLMAVSLYLVWSQGLNTKNAKIGVVLFGLQLLLNAGWSIAFFGLHSPYFGLLVIIPLWASIIATIYFFNKVSTHSALLLAPYLSWVSFAMLLNYFIWTLN